jgi:hypothetical protein
MSPERHMLDVRGSSLVLVVTVGLLSCTYYVSSCGGCEAGESGLRAVEEGTIEWNAGIFARSTAVARWVATVFSGCDRDTCWNTHIRSRGFSCSRSHQDGMATGIPDHLKTHWALAVDGN